MEGILSQHGLSSSLWEATFLGEDSWRLCSLLQKQREREENASNLSTLRKAVLLFREQVEGNVWKSSTYDTDSVLGLFLPLLELPPQAQFRFPRAVTLGPHFSDSLHMLHHTTWVWLFSHLHIIDHYPKFSYSFIWVPVDHWPTSKRYHQKSRICQDTAVTTWVLQQCWLEMGTQ